MAGAGGRGRLQAPGTEWAGSGEDFVGISDGMPARGGMVLTHGVRRQVRLAQHGCTACKRYGLRTSNMGMLKESVGRR